MLPVLPQQLHKCFIDALNSDRLRSMPNSFLPAYPQHRAPLARNVLLVGDALNMRHPLTGGGMTVGLSDVVLLSQLLAGPLSKPEKDVIDFKHDKEALLDAAESWYWARKQSTATINVLAQALYSLFSAQDENLEVLKTACFKYFERGGNCVNEPVAILGGISSSPFLLFYHFFSVAFYAIYLLFARPALGLKSPPGLIEYPALTLRSFSIVGVLSFDLWWLSQAEHGGGRSYGLPASSFCRSSTVNCGFRLGRAHGHTHTLHLSFVSAGCIDALSYRSLAHLTAHSLIAT